MLLTPNQRASHLKQLKALTRELESIERNTKRTFRSMILFAVIGIFIFPCFIVAIICYFLQKWGKGRALELQAEIDSIQQILATA